MSWRPEAKALLIVLAFLAILALPVVAADHSYSHRFIVYGRVVDANNDPVPGLTVDNLPRSPFAPEAGGCAQQPGTETEAFGRTEARPITNEFGEFMFCWHHHAQSRTTPGGALFKISAVDFTEEVEFDGFMRYKFVTFKLPTVQDTANTEINSQFYTVMGRAWRPSGGPINVDGVRVYGDTAHNKPVNVSFTYNGKETVFVDSTTNNYGDYAIRIPITERPTSGKVTMTIENMTFTQDLSPTGVTSFRAELPHVRDPFVTKFLIGLGIAAVVIVGGGGLWFASSRMRASREERTARERSTRKRSR